ncbi:Tetratricopeptide_repeat protein [Hexamita inflata]|uniref:Outer dynein arm-docking complex subunit 4 n=1 Tax=Hexamita inflata TaxID=28002 RepID=A0AA86R6Z0_9EUKA|nr:Tetratricopeptide repeat protein [Hexamita inflata]
MADQIKNFKDSVLLDQAKLEYERKQFKIAAHYATQAIDLNQDNPKPYMFRSQCYNALSQTEQAVNDANKSIELENELKKNYFRNTQKELCLCDGYFTRAEAYFFAGRFEDALIDYHRCKRSRQDTQYDLGIANSHENIRKAFDYSNEDIEKAIQCLDKGVIIEQEIHTVTYKPECNVQLFSKTLEVSMNSSLTTMTPIPIDQSKKCSVKRSMNKSIKERELLLNDNQILRSVENTAQKSESYKKVGKLSLDKEFLKFISDMPQLVDICNNGINYIEKREKYWETQSKTQQEYQEIRPKSVKNKFVQSKQNSLYASKSYNSVRRQNMMQKLQDDIQSGKFVQTQSQSYKQQVTPVDEEKVLKLERQQLFKLLKQSIDKACRLNELELQEEFIDQLIETMSTKQDQLLMDARLMKSEILFVNEKYDQVIQIKDKSLESKRLQALAFLRLERINDAVTLLENLAQSDNIQIAAESKILLSELFYKTRLYQEAYEYCQQAVIVLKQFYKNLNEVYEINGQMFNIKQAKQVVIQGLKVKADCQKQLNMIEEMKQTKDEIQKLI